MIRQIHKSPDPNFQTIQISGSKSETNRLLLLQALYPDIKLKNISNADDAKAMGLALQKSEGVINIHHAGTAMRFLTAFFAIKNGAEVVITGSERMKERPIAPLVEALNKMGAHIQYLEKQGFPPLHIKGVTIQANEITIPANISSQYITALLLIAPKLPNGLNISLEGEITSLPYLQMTLALLNSIGVVTNFQSNKIIVKPLEYLKPIALEITSDWSSLSYFYAIVAHASVGTTLAFTHFDQKSIQGDAALQEIYTFFGVKTTFKNHSIILEKINCQYPKKINLDLINTPDIAQTIAVTCLALKIPCILTGLHTLKIKETDRLQALKNELEKLGAKIIITHQSLEIVNDFSKKNQHIVCIKTYEDHRMAMAFAPLALLFPIQIENPDVVTKSYPNFWDDLKKIGFHWEDLI